jgi:hypothetical protein
MTTWETWAAGVLNGISAPINATTVDVLWAWSGSESGTADRMRWNNPLNTTLQWLSPPSHPMNSVGVQVYMDVASGIAATVDTLVNGYYPTICSHLRGSVPRAQWGDACHELGVWGTGCAWLQPTYGPAPDSLIPVPAPPPPTWSEPDVITGRPDNIFARGTDNGLYQRRWDGTKWLDWSRIDPGSVGVLLSQPRIPVARDGNHIELYIVGGQPGYNAYRLTSEDAGVNWTLDDIGGDIVNGEVEITVPASGTTEPTEPSVDLSSVTSILTVLNAKLDAIASRLAKDLA